MSQASPEKSSSNEFNAMLDWVAEGVQEPEARQVFIARQWADLIANDPQMREAIMRLSFEIAPNPEDTPLRGKVARALTGLIYLNGHRDMNQELEALHALPAYSETPPPDDTQQITA